MKFSALIPALAAAESIPRPLVGINYFSGWWKGPGNKWMQPWNQSVDWRPLYPERVPLLGDYNVQATMDAEIEAASQHGVDFFQILWYDNYPSDREPGATNLNNGVRQFMASSNADKMRFYIEWCNAVPFYITDDAEWRRIVVDDWLPAFRHESYLRVDGALVFKVHSGPDMKFNCNKSDDCVSRRLDELRATVRAAGLGEMIIGAGSAYNDASDPAKWWGYPYNFTNFYCGVAQDNASFTGKVLPWANESDYISSWRLKQSVAAQARGGITYVPSVVSGWDPRPWREMRASYVFPTNDEWVAEVEAVLDNLREFRTGGFPTRGGVNDTQPAFSIYAWNEFGEGGIMAPSSGWNYTRLESLASVIDRYWAR